MTPEQIKAKFIKQGKTVNSWAIANGYRPNDVYRILNGQLRGHRGRSHEIAVKLGLKPRVS